MTKLLNQAFEATRKLPPDAQDDIARVVLRLAGADDEPPVSLRPEEQTAIAASKAAAARCDRRAGAGGLGQTRPVRLRYTLPALADLAAILDHITVHSPQSARRVQACIQALTELLLLYPRIGRRTSDPAIRRMTITPYPQSDFLRGDRHRGDHSRGPACGP